MVGSLQLDRVSIHYTDISHWIHLAPGLYSSVPPTLFIQLNAAITQ